MAVASRVPTAFGKIVFLGGEVVNVNGPALEHRAAGHPATVDRQPLGGMAGRWHPAIRGDLPEKVTLQAEDHRIVGVAKASGVFAHRVEYRLDLGRRTGDDTQNLRGRGLLLQRLGKVTPRLGEFTGARFELLFQLDQGIGLVANVRSRLRSGRTKLAAACWAICAFERQGHLVGTATGPPSGRPSQGSSQPILTEPHDELAPSHHSITSSARSRIDVGSSIPIAL